MKPPEQNPWRWATDRRISYVLKILLIVALVFYVGQYVVAILDRIHAVIYILIGAVFFAYLIYPAVHWLSKRMPMMLAILTVYAGIAVFLAAAGWFVLPRLSEEVTLLVQRYPDITAQIDAALKDQQNPISANLPGWARDELSRVPAQLGGWVRQHGAEAAGHALLVMMGTFAAIATFIIVPLITAYLLLDLERFKRDIAAIVPADRWRTTLELLAQFDAVIGGFVRGQLIVALTVGILITIALTLLHVRYAFLLGLVAAIGDLIPYVGAFLAAIPALGIAFATNGLTNALLVGVAFLVIFEAEGHLIAPNIVSKTVKLSALVVVLSLLIGAELAGIPGMLIAVPIAGVVRVVLVRVFPPREANGQKP